MKKYKEFLIIAEPFNVELLSSILWELDITGINEDVNCIRVFADSESDLDSVMISNQLQKLQKEKLLRDFRVELSVHEEKNWNEEWEKSLNIIHVTDKVVIKPSFKEYEKKNDEIVITIDPKMSFGTGEHQTTKLIIGLIEKYVKHGMNILDAGTGTGILAITSAMFGASKIVGFDSDEWCYENALENCLLNNVSEKIEIRIGEIDTITEKDFDLILANIQKNILIELAERFKEKLKAGGFILLSGLLSDDEEDILKIYSGSGFKQIETIKMDEWIAIVFQKI
jgi:ribosomal protein L11 methyltransferase